MCRRARPRPFGVGDAMILVAAMAVGTLAIRWSLTTLADLRADVAGVNPGMRRFLYVQYAGSAFNPYLAAVTVALLVIRLRRPHPGWRRVARQPGFIACAVATAAMAIEAAWIGALLAMGSGFIHVTTIFVGYAQQVSFAVVGGWIALAVSGRWRAEKGWIDRAGCAAGVMWIGVTGVHFSAYFLII